MQEGSNRRVSLGDPSEPLKLFLDWGDTTQKDTTQRDTTQGDQIQGRKEEPGLEQLPRHDPARSGQSAPRPESPRSTGVPEVIEIGGKAESGQEQQEEGPKRHRGGSQEATVAQDGEESRPSA